MTTPFETRIKNFSHVAKYFLYYAPNIDSAQSSGRIEGEVVEKVFQDMINKAGLVKRYKIVKKVQPTIWKEHQLDEDLLDFEIARFTCNRFKDESNLQAVLRHLRNSLAHGYLYVWKKRSGNYVLLVDYDKGKGKATAKMMLSMDILEKWKAILESQIAIGE